MNRKVKELTQGYPHNKPQKRYLLLQFQSLCTVFILRVCHQPGSLQCSCHLWSPSQLSYSSNAHPFDWRRNYHSGSHSLFVPLDNRIPVPLVSINCSRAHCGPSRGYIPNVPNNESVEAELSYYTIRWKQFNVWVLFFESYQAYISLGVSLCPLAGKYIDQKIFHEPMIKMTHLKQQSHAAIDDQRPLDCYLRVCRLVIAVQQIIPKHSSLK